MTRLLFAAAAFGLMTAAVVTAQNQPEPKADPKTQPEKTEPEPKAGKAGKGGGVQPGGFGKATQPGDKANPWTTTTRVTAARLSQLEEDFETLEAHRDVKRAYVHAAQVGVKSAEVGYERVAALATKGVVTRGELDKAKVEIEAAKAQLEIRAAEMKEVEVKIKFARKRLDEAKAATAKLNPKAVDPVPPPVEK